MKSRFLGNIESRITSEVDELRIDCLLAEKGAYLARLGKSDEARGILDALGRKNLRRPNIELSIHLNFAEGVSCFYSNMGSAALDRFRRAQVLSQASGLTTLHANAAAWLAHLAFGRHDFGAMAKEIETAILLAGPESHACLSRVSLVIGQAFHLANHPDAARWYAKARVHALEIGDETTISAIIHNMAVIGVASARQQVLQWRVSAKDAALGTLSVDSTNNFDKLVGIASLDSLTPILRAQAFSLAERFEAALELYSSHLTLSLSQGMSRIECWLLADQAWCKLNIGNGQAAIDDVQRALQRLSAVQVDDLAATHSRLGQIYASIGDERRATNHNGIANELWITYSGLQKEIVHWLRAVDGLSKY